MGDNLLDFDTLQYKGTKWIVLSNTTPLGGRNPYIGIAYLAIGGLCVLVGLVFALAQLIKPRYKYLQIVIVIILICLIFILLILYVADYNLIFLFLLFVL